MNAEKDTSHVVHNVCCAGSCFICMPDVDNTLALATRYLPATQHLQLFLLRKSVSFLD